MFGQPFTGARATKAGSKLHGGSYALVMIRQVFLKKLHCRNVFYECMLLTLIRGIGSGTVNHGTCGDIGRGRPGCVSNVLPLAVLDYTCT